jgi:hypothetical protein
VFGSAKLLPPLSLEIVMEAITQEFCLKGEEGNKAPNITGCYTYLEGNS